MDFQTIGYIVIAGAVVIFIAIIQIANRLSAIKNNQETLVKIQTFQGIASGALQGKTCKTCEKVYAVELALDKNYCSHCGAENIE